MKYDIFISYRRSGGKGCARSLKEALEKNGYSVFLDIDELKDGHFIEAIHKAIDSSKIFLLVMSADVFSRCSDPDDHLRIEVEYALKKKKSIIPVVQDKLIPTFPEEIPSIIYSGISSLQYSFLDSEHLFKESLNKIIKERIVPVVGDKSRSKSNSKIILWFSVVLTVAALIFGLLLYKKICSMSRYPVEYIDYADELADIQISPKGPEEINQKKHAKKILWLYRRGAEGCEKVGEENLDIYIQTNDLECMDNAYFNFHNAGYAYSCVGNYKIAVKNYIKAIYCGRIIAGRTDTDSVQVAYSINNLAYCYLWNGDSEKALETIDDAIAFWPEALNSWDSKGEILYKLGRYKEAIDVWGEIQIQDPYFIAEYWVDSCKVALGCSMVKE